MPPTIDPFYRGDKVLLDASLFQPGTTEQARTWYVNHPPSAGGGDMEVCSSLNGGGTWMRVPVDKVKLVRRGNHFKYRFGMPLSFASLADEASFWQQLDKLQELRNPATGLYYTWTLEQAIEALEQGTADVFLVSIGHVELITGKRTIGGYTIDIPEVAMRMREQCLAELRAFAAQAVPV